MRNSPDGAKNASTSDKDAIRLLHSAQRQEHLESTADFIRRRLPQLIKNFASGTEVVPARITPRLELVLSGTQNADLFRLASFTWSVPVSQGYGRRMRFLIWDDYNDKLIGIMALGDPVFNLRVRDSAVGWQVEDRRNRLVDVMDAYVLGALPPYNMLLGGKLVACLVRTREVRDHFAHRYRSTRGVISRQKKLASLVLVTTSSSLGRSSVYNRLRLGDIQYFQSVGYTEGWGHFHIQNGLFNSMREYLRLREHDYWNDYRFGSGPSWKMRVIRAALQSLGMDGNLLRHGIRREVFLCRLASNADQVLSGEVKRPKYKGLLSVAEVSDLALDRWLCPRAARRPEYTAWDRNRIAESLSLSRCQEPQGGPMLDSAAGAR
jgi:hypothetical protein